MRFILALILLPLMAPAQDDGGGSGFYFNPLRVKRDPFLPSGKVAKVGPNDLIAYDLAEMNLVAVLSGMGSPKAMILLPNGKTHIVQKGDRIGRNRGRVTRILADKVNVKESFKDYRGQVRSSTSTIELAN